MMRWVLRSISFGRQNEQLNEISEEEGGDGGVTLFKEKQQEHNRVHS